MTDPTKTSSNAATRRCAGFLAACALALEIGVGGTGSALAAGPAIAMPGPDLFDSGQPGAANGQPSFLSGLNRSGYLLGDMWGLRTALAKYGISIALQETSEVTGNLTGGIHRGATYDGLTQMALQMDTMRAFGLYGGLFNVSAEDIHGRSLSADNLMNLQTASGIEADRSLRLWELWYQQKFLEEDRLDIKIGQQSLDQEFMVNPNGAYLMNTMFGWPMVPSADLPGGGPAYPLSALGVRARWRPVDPIALLLGVFNGSPSPSGGICCSGDAQQQDGSGTSFPLNGGVMVIAEAQYSYPSLGTMLYADQAEPLARVYKVGGWYNTQNVSDLQFDNTGLSLANPSSNGVPLARHGDYGVYATADQIVWVDPKEGDRTISLFGRVLWAPQADRNLITFSMNAGLTFHEPFLHRDDDTFSVGMGYAKVSTSAASLDKETAFYTGSFVPTRSSETYLEISYQYQAAPWLQLQPDMQYVFNPGGGLANPNVPGQKIGNEFILGVRTNILF